MKEIYSRQAEEELRRRSRRFVIILAASILILFALTVGALYAIFKARLKRDNASMKGAIVSSK